MATPINPTDETSPGSPPDAPFEVTFPAAPTPSTPAPGPDPSRPMLKIAALLTAIILALGLVGGSTYALGYQQGRAHTGSAQDVSAAPIKVPEGTTIISQCAVGRGTQYVLPSNIPHGPVFDVYKGNVIGLEYMIGSDDLADAVSFYNLPLYGKKYDHIDIGLVSNGHAGYPERHYHVDLYNVSRAASAAITCK